MCKHNESTSIFSTEKERDRQLKNWEALMDRSRRKWSTAEPWYPPQVASAKVLFWLSCTASATIVISLTLAALALAGWL